MLFLAAVALVAFAVALLVLASARFARTRAPRDLLFGLVAVLALGALVFFSSRLALQLFGGLPFALNLPEFARALVPLAIGVVAAALAVLLFVLARRRIALALGLSALVPALLLAGLYLLSIPTPEPTTAAITHPVLADIDLPKGFHVSVFAADLHDPNAIAFDGAGALYYTELVDGNIVRLRDTNGDGAADESHVVASGFKNPRGLTWREGALYVSSRGQVNVLRDTNGDGAADENRVLIDGLFSLDIQHSNNGIAFGPDGRLYIAIGGPRVGQLELRDHTYYYKDQPRDDWQFGGILAVNADGTKPQLFARGLRNPYGLAFAPDGRLFATDNGDETIPVPDGDELNLIEPGADYGYPYFFGLPAPWSGTRAPLIAFVPHTAPTGVTVYNAPASALEGAAFPKGYRDSVFVALYWHGQPGARYREIVRVSEGKDNGRVTWTPRAFATGLDRPTALAVGPDGALYVADMRGGKADPEAPGALYRIFYDGK